MAKGIYSGAGGVSRNVKKIYVGVGGVARAVKKVYVGVAGVARLAWQSGLPIGTAWSWKNSGYTSASYSFTVLQSGYYTVQVHGGGGGGGKAGYGYGLDVWSDGWGGGGYEYFGSARCNAGGGGGSGNRWTNVWLSKGQTVSITVGAGGAYTDSYLTRAALGGTSSFAVNGGSTYSCAGGIGGIVPQSASDLGGGAGSGNLAGSGAGGVGLGYNTLPFNGGIGGSSGTSEIYQVDETDGWGNYWYSDWLIGKGGTGGGIISSTNAGGLAYMAGTKGNNGGVFLTLTSY